jgi:type IV pilus assembly protein PilC
MSFSKNFPAIAIIGSIVGVLAFFGLRYLVKNNRSAKKLLDQFKLSIPILRPFLRNLYLSRLTRTLEGLVASGVSIIEALKITANAVGNVLYEDSLNELAEDVKSGKPMSEPMKTQDIYPPIVSQMISVGEQTGEMDTMLGNLADYFEEEVDNFVKSLTSIIEPLLIVVMAAIVGVMLIAIMMPIYQFGGIVGK